MSYEKDNTHSESHSSELVNSDKDMLSIIIEEYKLAVKTQMHFNDMIMRMRTTAISVFLALISASAISLQYNMTLTICQHVFHASIFIVIMGIVLFVSIYIIDVKYYNQMLIGAVNKTYKMDETFKLYTIKQSSFLGQATLIKDAIGLPGASKCYIRIFYLIPIFFSILFIIVILIGYTPMPTS